MNGAPDGWWRRLPLVTTALSIAALGVTLAPGAGALLDLDRARLWIEPWRLLTGHLVHWSTDHLLWDLSVFVGFGCIAERRGRGTLVSALLGSAMAISVAVLLVHPEISVYRGLSGVDSALLGVLLVHRLGGDAISRLRAGLTLIFFAGKVAWEMSTGTALFVEGVAGVVVLPAVHLAGLACGALVGVAARRWERSRLSECIGAIPRQVASRPSPSCSAAGGAGIPAVGAVLR